VSGEDRLAERQATVVRGDALVDGGADVVTGEFGRGQFRQQRILKTTAAECNLFRFVGAGDFDYPVGESEMEAARRRFYAIFVDELSPIAAGKRVCHAGAGAACGRLHEETRLAFVAVCLREATQGGERVEEASDARGFETVNALVENLGVLGPFAEGMKDGGGGPAAVLHRRIAARHPEGAKMSDASVSTFLTEKELAAPD
jgi:hypothetical protein